MSVEQEILVTGIKVADLLAPYAKGGKNGLLGGAGVGKTVLMELVNNVAKDNCIEFSSNMQKIVPKDDTFKLVYLTRFMGYKARMTHIVREVDRPGYKVNRKEVAEGVIIINGCCWSYWIYRDLKRSQSPEDYPVGDLGKKERAESSYQVKVPILKQFHKFDIGKGGANIRRCRDETDTKIYLPDSGTNNDMITITGKEENVNKAVTQIQQIQSEMANITTKEMRIPATIHNT